MKHYDILVTVHYPEGAKNTTRKKIGYILKADDELAAKVAALSNAQLTQLEHPRIYKGCTFSIAPEDIKLFTF